MPKMIDGKRLLTWLNKEYQGIYQNRADMQAYAPGALIELGYIIDHVEQMVNKGGTNGKKD